MRALVATRHGGPEVLEMRDDHPEPVPGEHDVLVEVHACALNPVDWKVMAGLLGERATPFVTGFDVSGVVRAVGAAVESWSPGDEVFASPSLARDGALAERVCVDGRLLARRPRHLDHVRSAALPLVTLTAWEALYDRCQLGTDETVLVHAGAGGVGHVALQLAEQRVARVITTASRHESKALCRELGADVVIDYSEEDFVERVMAETAGRGCDVVFDTVGGETFDRSLDCVAVNGRMATIVANESTCISQTLFRKNATLHYEFMGVAGIHGVGREAQVAILDSARELADHDALRPHVGREIGLEDVPAALAGQKAGHSMGKTVVRIR
jgi:NADPH2:quinone reductase